MSMSYVMLDEFSQNLNIRFLIISYALISQASTHNSGRSHCMIGPDPFFVARSTRLAALALRQAVPTVFEFRQFVAAGGLMSYGGSLTDVTHVSAQAFICHTMAGHRYDWRCCESAPQPNVLFSCEREVAHTPFPISALYWASSASR
jgi:hypothetical protein